MMRKGAFRRACLTWRPGRKKSLKEQETLPININAECNRRRSFGVIMAARLANHSLPSLSFRSAPLCMFAFDRIKA
jgi:hypothetical protein